MPRTVVSMTLREGDDLDEARNALWALATGLFGPVEVTRPGSSGPAAATYLTVSVPGDARDDVRRQLEHFTSLSYDVDLREDL